MKKIKFLLCMALPVAALLIAACETDNDNKLRNVPLPPETQ
jgi:hypothetical protein